MTNETNVLEPIAIVGIGCRFPGGANDPENFWDLLINGVDAVRTIPSDRWEVEAFYDPDPSKEGKMYTKYGGFLESVDKFDPEFFGIAPREAKRIDPQQRLFLEVSWEALENAGQSPDQLYETKTGVFAGVSNHDYYTLLLKNGPSEIDAYYGTGPRKIRLIFVRPACCLRMGDAKLLMLPRMAMEGAKAAALLCSSGFLTQG